MGGAGPPVAIGDLLSAFKTCLSIKYVSKT